MLIAWAYNELGENITPTDQSFDLRFSRPSGASTDIEMLVGSERMRCASWGAKTALTDITLSAVTRGANNTAPKYHKAGDAVWLRNEIAQISTADMLLGKVTLSSTFTGGDVHTIISDGADGYYVGGDFTTVGGSATYGGLAHVNSYGVVDTSFKPLLAGGSAICRAMYILSNGNILVGGNFTTLAGTACNGLGIIDTDGDFVADISQYSATGVYKIVANSTKLFVGGQNLTAALATLIRFDLAELVGSNPGAAAVDDYFIFHNGGVRDMFLDGDTLYTSGVFTGVLVITNPGPASVSRGGGAAFRTDLDVVDVGRDTTPALLDWDPATNGYIYAMLKHGDHVYLGGTFTTVGGTATTRLARVASDASLDTTWTPTAIDSDVLSLAVLDNTVDGVDYIVAGGNFTTPQTRLALFSVDDDSDSWAVAPDAEVRTIVVDSGRIIIGGDFANLSAGAADSFAIISDDPVASEIGVYKLEWLDPGSVIDPTTSVRMAIYYGAPTAINKIYDELITTGTRTRDGISFESGQFTLERPADTYIVELTITKASGITVDYLMLESGTVAGVILVPDGVEVGDQYDKSDTFAAPGISKVSSTYNLTPATQAGTPTATNPTHYWRMWLIVDPSGGFIDDYQVTFGGSLDTVDITDDFYYFARIGYDTNGTSNLTVTARDSGTLTLVSTGPHSVTATAASSNVDADQIQMEYEFTDGAWTGRVIADWQDIPGGGVLSFNNIGPAAHQFRFRYRYRTFRRDGIDLETGRPVMVSQWSSWTALT